MSERTRIIFRLSLSLSQKNFAQFSTQEQSYDGRLDFKQKIFPGMPSIVILTIFR